MENTDLTLTILQNIRADIATLGGRFGTLEGRFGTLERRFDTFEGRFDILEGRFDTLEGRFDTLTGEVAAMRKDVQACLTRDEFRGALLAMNIAVNERFECVERRVTDVETRTAASHRELQGTIRQLTAQVGQHGSLAARIGLCECDIIDIKKRVF